MTNLKKIVVDDLPATKPEVDDDARSWSTLSVASGSSLASETLEKARLRRDQFWGKPGK